MTSLPCIYARPADAIAVAVARLPAGEWRTCGRPAFGKAGAFVSPCRSDSRSCGESCQGYEPDSKVAAVECVEFGPTPEKVIEKRVDPLAAAIQKAVGPNITVSIRKPLPPARPDRCRHLGKRTERKSGCNGWKCAHDCDLGLAAVPGVACQTCEKYEADPDYAGQGPKGWLQ